MYPNRFQRVFEIKDITDAITTDVSDMLDFAEMETFREEITKDFR